MSKWRAKYFNYFFACKYKSFLPHIFFGPVTAVTLNLHFAEVDESPVVMPQGFQTNHRFTESSTLLSYTAPLSETQI